MEMKHIKAMVSKSFGDACPLFEVSTREQRLDEAERLRREAGKFLYEYTARLQRVFTAVREI
jgi:hypothetical protein